MALTSGQRSEVSLWPCNLSPDSQAGSPVLQSSKWAHSTCTDKKSKKVCWVGTLIRSWFCWGNCPLGVQFTDRIVLMEGEIYWRPQLEIIDNGYLSGVQGYFIVNIFRGMGSLIVPSCSTEIPLVQFYEDQAGVFDTSAQNCPTSKLYLCPPNCAARITNTPWRASSIFSGFQIMLFICFRRLAKSPGLLSNKEQIKRREASGASWKFS